jgi:hypothetical protein
MRGVAAIVALGLALLVSGCDANDRQYFREGIGTELYTADTASATELQNIYLDYLCRQSSPYVGTDVPTCSQQIVQANFWPVIVQAGMNDIDARCDSYLAWLDLKKRENAGILAELGAVRFAVDALTIPSQGISQMGLAAVSAAFGLANGTVNNFNSLLLQVDHTTVQNVVFSNRHIFRESLLKHLSEIDNKPAAIHTLRTYLSICMPMTIAANINSTVTVFQQTGSGAGAGPMAPTIGAPFTPAGVVQKPPRAPPAPPDVEAPFFAEKNLSKDETEFTLGGLCIDKNQGTGLPKADLIKALIAIYEATPDPDNPPTPDGIISRNERLVINKQSNCNAAKNYFEKVVFANTQSPAKTEVSAATFANFVTDLLKRSSAGGDLAGTPALASQSLREKIRAVRTNLGLTDVPSPLSTQATPALVTALKKLPKSN